METDAAPKIATRGVLAFNVGNICLGARVEEVSGLLDAERIAPLPRQMSGLVGVVAFRGDVVPVLDLVSYLGLEPPRVGNPRYAVILTRGADRFGVLVPELPRLVHPRDLGDAELSTSDPELGELIASVYQAEGRSVHCLNYWHIFDSIMPAAASSATGSRAHG